VTLFEQKTRFNVATKAANKTARAITDASCDYLKPYQDRVFTLTYENGKEFAYHEEIARELTTEGFFAHPYHPWERGLNENTNVLNRQYAQRERTLMIRVMKTWPRSLRMINMLSHTCLGFKAPN
jgi:transposase, IS30 family